MITTTAVTCFCLISLSANFYHSNCEQTDKIRRDNSKKHDRYFSGKLSVLEFCDDETKIPTLKVEFISSRARKHFEGILSPETFIAIRFWVLTQRLLGKKQEIPDIRKDDVDESSTIPRCTKKFKMSLVIRSIDNYNGNLRVALMHLQLMC